MRSHELWAITCYYNPAGYRRRLSNYREFRRRLAVPLVCVELAFDREFQLGPGDAEVLVQLRGGSVLWQKERLLNIAWDHLPPECGKVAWLDCDVFFEDETWAAQTSRMLDRCAVVQPFSMVCELPATADLDRPSVADGASDGVGILHHMALSGGDPHGLLSSDMRARRTHSGLAWAARRKAFEGIGFYDACVVGSGNRAIFCASIGRADDAVSYLRMNPRWEEHYRDWASVHTDRVGGRVGFVEARLFHLWHGDLENRRYAERHQGLAGHGFDPTADIAVGPEGPWVWSSDKPAMHDFVRRYFEGRREDG